MLVEFSVKNFLSFKDKVTLSMEKGNGDENLDNIISNNNIDLLKTAAIYGANVSGKSNILKALTCAILMVRNSNLIPVGGKWNFIKPFLFDEVSKEKPSEFEFIFIVNNVKYRYFFSVDNNKVYDEILDAYYSQKPTNIFTRTNTNKYEFNSDKNKLETLVNSADLYNLLTKYALHFYNDTNKTSLLNTKSCILYSYAEMERENWSEAKNYISKAKNEFANVLNNQVNNINRIDIINKAYILINELEEDSNNMDRKIFLINYSNLIQELQSI